ncbi:hypothetical protein EON67_09855 [archaeon]|nr:MAG: hypothetical protein EON67_09855 [archaeon]
MRDTYLHDLLARAACSSFPQARIPNGPAERVYDIKYYTRDVRRNSLPSDIPVERSFLGDASKSLAGVQYIEAPKEGSPGMKVCCRARRAVTPTNSHIRAPSPARHAHACSYTCRTLMLSATTPQACVRQ